MVAAHLEAHPLKLWQDIKDADYHGLSEEDFLKIYEAMECLAVIKMNAAHEKEDKIRIDLVKKVFTGSDEDILAYI